MDRALPLLIVIAGPTAAGKTALSLYLAECFNTEIISADSRQFYKEMNVGTAKPSAAELKKIPHYFINNLSIHDEYSVGQYEKEALQCLYALFKKHNKVILAGGSGLFIDALCNGIDTLPPADMQLRAYYNTMLKEQGIESLQAELKEKDLVYFEIADIKNPHRLMRALEVIQLTGMLYSQLRTKKQVQRNFSILKIGITPDKEELHRRIDQRADEMLTGGWLDECKQLYPFKHLNALKTVGYTQLFDFIDGKHNWQETVEKIKTDTRRYAKRQLTWFKKDKEIKWFTPKDYEQIRAFITTFAPA